MLDNKTAPRFVVQKENGLLSPDAAQFIDSICQWNWLMQKSDMYYETCGLNQLQNMDLNSDDVPFGSLEFVQQALSLITGHEDIKIPPINVPVELCDHRFAGRKVWRWNKADAVARFEGLAARGETSRFFVKSDVETKGCFYVGTPRQLVTIMKNEPDDTRLFVSAEFSKEIWSEWRVFVYRSRIIDMRPYYFMDIERGEYKMPDITAVMEMIRAWNTIPAACTLDVAVFGDGTTYLVEAHNFVSCGLYGCDSPRLPAMAKAAFRQELSIAKENHAKE